MVRVSSGNSQNNQISTNPVLRKGDKGDKGDTGNGIASINLTSTSGLVDTYTISFTDGTSTTFTVTNGNGIASVVKTSTSGRVDTYTITFTNGTTTTFTVTNGQDGNVTNVLVEGNSVVDSGVAKIYLQNAPFSINNGTVVNGENATLTYSDNIVSCAPCVITSVNGRTFNDSQTRTLDVSEWGNHEYYVFKNSVNGAISTNLAVNFSISKTAPLNPSNNKYWLDISVKPAVLKTHNGTNWNVNNNLVWIGSFTKSDGSITSLTNRKFNDSGYTVVAFDADVNFSNITQTAYDKFQAPLVSGTNIKTVNSNSLLGSGNIAVQETLTSGTNIKTINSNSVLGSGNITVANLSLSNLNSTGEAHFANPDLQNLSTLGNARLQYAPFAINAGSVDSNGDNNTLTYSGSVLTCAPCIVTTAAGVTYIDSETRTFTATNQNGTLAVFKNTNNGSISFVAGITISKKAPTTTWWLDISKIPAILKRYTNGAWEENTTNVYIGDCTLSSGTITSVTNRKFNDSGYLTQRYVTDSIYPDYSAAYALSGISTTSTSFDAPNDGYVSAHLSTNNSGTVFYIDDRPVGFVNANGTFDRWTTPFLVKKGSHTFKVNANANLVLAVEFYPMKGVI